RRHTRCYRDWSSDVCSSDLTLPPFPATVIGPPPKTLVAVLRVTSLPAATPTVHRPSPVTPAALTPILCARFARVQVAPVGSFWRSEERRVGKEGRGRDWREC